jgi:hypothetical protein
VKLIRRVILAVELIAAAAMVVMLILAGAFLWESPIAFQKASAVKVGVDPVIEWSAESPVLDARRVIGSIPYSSTSAIYDLLPSRLYEQTMLYGKGNCANKCRGLSVYLSRAGIPFHRVDIIPINGFLYGQGHTLVRTKYEVAGEVRVGIIDVLEGSYLALGGRPVDLDDLRRATPFSIEMKQLTPLADGQSDYYGTFLNDVVVATTNPDATRAYFRFIETVYVPLGNPRFERLFFNALAVVCGYFPGAQISQADYDRLFAGREWIVWSAGVLRWSARIVLLLLPFIVIERTVRLVRRILRGRTDDPSAAQPSGAGPSITGPSTTMAA